MTKAGKRSLFLGALLVLGVGAFAVPALADGNGKEGCAKKAEARFAAADKNNDGALTADEVGDKRWAHIKVADANNDGKVTLAELKQAHADGKLGHKHHGKGKHKHKEKDHSNDA